MVSIAAFQAVDPGSIPGQRTGLLFIFFNPFYSCLLYFQLELKFFFVRFI